MSNPENEMTPQPFFDTKQRKCQIKWLHKIAAYYGWLKADMPCSHDKSVLHLTDFEHQAIGEKKKAAPHMSHRQISRLLRHEGYWISPSSCYRVLKSLGWVLSPALRQAPWKVPHYEPFRPNQIWGKGWTALTIAGVRHYLLTIIDYFSRFIVAWGVVKTVTHREVQNLLTLAYIGEGIEQQEQKPTLRADQRSPNRRWQHQKTDKRARDDPFSRPCVPTY